LQLHIADLGEQGGQGGREERKGRREGGRKGGKGARVALEWRPGSAYVHCTVTALAAGRFVLHNYLRMLSCYALGGF